MTKIKSINPNQIDIAQNADVSLKFEGNTAQVTFTAGKNRKCPIKNYQRMSLWIYRWGRLRNIIIKKIVFSHH